MNIWMLIGLVIYLGVAITLLVGITKHSNGAGMQFSYFIVAVFWPLWLTYFIISILYDLWRFRKSDELL